MASRNSHIQIDTVQALQPADTFELIERVSGLLTETDLKQVFHRILHLATDAVGADAVSLFVHEDDMRDWGHIVTARNLPQEQAIPVVKSVMATGFAGWVYRHRHGAIVTDTLTDKRWLSLKNDTSDTRSALCVPFMENDQVMAVLTLTHHEPDHFTEDHLRLMQIIVNQAQLAMRNASLFDRTETQRHQLTTMFASIDDAIIVFDNELNIVMLNDKAIGLIGRDAEELIGNTLHRLRNVDSAVRAAYHRLRKIRDEDSSQLTWMMEERSLQQERDFQITMARWRDDDMNNLGYIMLLHDVSQLRDLSRFKDEIMRVAMHDLRGPLTLISGYTNMIDLEVPALVSQIAAGQHDVSIATDDAGPTDDDAVSAPFEIYSHLDTRELTELADMDDATGYYVDELARKRSAAAEAALIKQMDDDSDRSVDTGTLDSSDLEEADDLADDNNLPADEDIISIGSDGAIYRAGSIERCAQRPVHHAGKPGDRTGAHRRLHRAHPHDYHAHEQPAGRYAAHRAHPPFAAGTA